MTKIKKHYIYNIYKGIQTKKGVVKTIYSNECAFAALILDGSVVTWGGAGYVVPAPEVNE